MAEFTKEVNVERGSGAYRDFIKDLRVELGRPFHIIFPYFPLSRIHLLDSSTSYCKSTIIGSGCGFDGTTSTCRPAK
ncbi:hypothetical protein CsSME_00020153 [Camellia sinensis var. sinensis]